MIAASVPEEYPMKQLLFLTLLLSTSNLVVAQTESVETVDTSSEAPVYVAMRTNLGDIFLELDQQKAPNTVANFLSYAEKGFYDQTIFHRVVGGFVIQGGGFDVDLNKKPTSEPIKNEAANGLKNELGTIAMARTGDPHSATSQFFINTKPNPALNYTGEFSSRAWGYAVFGKVISGMNVVEEIAAVETGPAGPFPRSVPRSPVIIEKVERLAEPPAIEDEQATQTNPAQSDSQAPAET